MISINFTSIKCTQRVRISMLAIALGASPHNMPATAHAQRATEAAVPSKVTGIKPPTDAELSIWTNPSFQKQFVQSYLAETEIEPRVTANEREKMEKVLGLISSGKSEEAAKLLEKERTPAASAVIDFTLANIFFQSDKLDQAAAAYQAAVEKFPKFRRAWRNLALIHVRENEFERALPALTRVIELGGADAVTYGLLGFSYSSVENHISAESAYRMANLLDPAMMDWRLGLARSYFKQERYADAIALTKLLIEEHPDRTELWLLQANAYLGLGQPKRAAENYEIVDRLGQSTPDSLNMLGDIYVNDELFDLGVDCYVRALERGAEVNPDRALRAAKAVAAHGALDECQRLLDRVQELRGDQLDQKSQKDLLKLKTRLAVARGASDEEARLLEEVVSLDPLDGEALILLGQHRHRSGDDEKAIFYFERAESIQEFEADAKVRHAQLLVKQGKYADSVPLLRRAQALQPRESVQRYLEDVERMSKLR